MTPNNAPALPEFQANWPRFRGWDGSGISLHFNPQISDDATNVAILWQSAIPAPGHSSPVVWGNHVFVSGATAARREVFCYHASTGALLWRRTVDYAPGGTTNVPEISEDVTHAASSMATDGRRVFVMFANGDLAALNFDGAIVWFKSFGPLNNPYGFATSLAIWRNVLLIQLDQGADHPKDSKLISLDAASGRILWERSRPVPASWATPIVIETAGKTQVITLANPWEIAYGLADGHELWRAQLLENEIVSSPVFAGGLVFSINPGSKLIALRPDGAGDVTKTSVAWTSDEDVPDITSPAANAEFVFTVSSGGMVVCFETQTGKKIWGKNLELGVKASPAIVDGLLLILGEDGALVMLQAGPRYCEMGRTQLPDKFTASPAFAGGGIFLRGTTNLYALEIVKSLGQVAR